MSSYMKSVITDIELERARQNQIWGDVTEADRHMPMGTHGVALKPAADAARRTTKDHSRAGTVTWYDILREEFLEAAAEDGSVENWPNLRKELVQTGAVIVAMIEAGDLRSDESMEYAAEAEKAH